MQQVLTGFAADHQVSYVAWSLDSKFPAVGTSDFKREMYIWGFEYKTPTLEGCQSKYGMRLAMGLVAD